MQQAFEAHGPGIARSVRALVGTHAVVEDLVQEVFVIAFTRIHAYGGGVPFVSWLRGIAVNVARNFRRRERRRGDLRRRFEPPRGERSETPEEALSTRRLGDRLWAAVDRLPDRQREAFVLRVIEQRSLVDCAAVLGVSIKAVSRRALAAEAKVRAAIEEKDEER